jgi:CubicO group peptidase (beta-lactamase class C family)
LRHHPPPGNLAVQGDEPMTLDMAISRRMALSAGLAGLLATATPVAAASLAAKAPLPDDMFDAVVRSFLTAFEIPGAAVAIVRSDQPPITRGYGVRKLGAPERVDADTVFAIASNSKAFVAASIAMLVEAGKLGWDDPIIDHMADFAMYDPVVTRIMTVRDLLCHRSGLSLGAGDLLQFPQTDHDRADMLHALRFLKPARGFRAGYDYDNILYVVAGILIERISGLSWEAFVTTRLFVPLGMRTAVASRALLKTANVAARHARLGPPTRGFGEQEVVEPDESVAASPAGGIHASVTDIVPWLAVQLARGRIADGTRLWSEASAETMWTPQVITASSTGPTPVDPTRPVLSAYALGWRVADYRKQRLLSHGGALSGQITNIALLPELGVGLAVFTNIENRLPGLGLRNALLDYLLGTGGTDWIAVTRRQMAAEEDKARSRITGGDFAIPAGGPSLPLDHYAGRYRDPWYGDILISEKRGRLMIDFTHTPVFKCALEPFGPDTFRTRFGQGSGEDAVLTFLIENGVPMQLRLRAISPIADFSFDFQDLAPRRVT